MMENLWIHCMGSCFVEEFQWCIRSLSWNKVVQFLLFCRLHNVCSGIHRAENLLIPKFLCTILKTLVSDVKIFLARTETFTWRPANTKSSTLVIISSIQVFRDDLHVGSLGINWFPAPFKLFAPKFRWNKDYFLHTQPSFLHGYSLDIEYSLPSLVRNFITSRHWYKR